MARVVRTACTRDCPDACQILATVEGDRIAGLRGDPEHPVTRGFLCYRTDHYLERQYSSDRLTTPLVRRNGALEPAPWDEALDLVAERLRKTLQERGASSILHYQSGGSLGLVKQLNRLFFELLGPVTHKSGDICSGAGDYAQATDMGHEDAHDLDDLANARTIVLWGKNVAETGVHLIPHLKAARARGAFIVEIDPVHSRRTLALCDRYIQVRPGGDGYLALAVARAALEEGWHDPAAAGYCDHWDAFMAMAHRHDVDGWASRAGVAPEEARWLAERYARHKPSTLFVGWGLGRRLHGASTIRLLDALGAISGNLGIPGGGVSYYFRRRGGFDLSFVKRPENADARSLPEALLGEAILSADPPIAAAVIDNGNPVSQLPDSHTVARALRSLDFLVVLDAFLTDTAELAHVVLPTTTMLEEHDVVGAYGHHFVQLAQPVVAPPEGVRSDLEIYQALAERLGIGAGLRGSTTMWIDRMLQPMSEAGVTRDALARRALRKPDAPHVLFAERRFATPTGRFNLIEDFPDEPPRLDAAFPLFLMSISTYRNQSSQIPASAQTEPPTVVVHPDAAAGRAAGSLARLVSTLGSVEVRLQLDPAQRRDVVIYPKGRWGKFGGPNSLTRARQTDFGGGAAYYDEGVRIE